MEIDQNIMRLIHEEERLCKQLEQLELMKDKPFYKFVREKLTEQLAAARNMAKIAFKHAIKTDSRQAYRAVLRTMYKERLGGDVKILDGKSSERRGVPEPTGGKSGIRRHRTVSGRTAKLLTYTGTAAGFLLRFINSGTDIRTAHADLGGRKSKATYGARGAIGAKDLFKRAVRMDARAQNMANQINQYIKANAINEL